MPKVEFEYEVKEIPLDANLPAAMEKLAAEGWVLAPGKVPIGVYHLVRDPGAQKDHIGHIRAELVVDDSKVFHIPAGQKPQ
jgi:hypothetical protein